MTTTTAHAGHHISTKTAAVAFAAVVLATGAGYGVSNLVLDDPVIQTPTAPGDEGPYDIDRYPGFDPNGYAGTDREERAFKQR